MLALDFKFSVPDSSKARDRVLQISLWALIDWDRFYLAWNREQGTPIPSIYQAGVRYIREPEGQEEWLDIGEIIARHGGDCEELAAWRVAELREQGIDARPAWRHRRVSTPSGKEASLYHILCWIPGTGFDDPSQRLGMGGPTDS